jgi:hypothetical protein
MIEDLCRLLRELKLPDTYASVGRAVGYDGVQVWRWTHGKCKPREKPRLALELLHRAAKRAADGHDDGRRVLDGFLRTPGLAGLGYHGAMIAAGLEWVLVGGTPESQAE